MAIDRLGIQNPRDLRGTNRRPVIKFIRAVAVVLVADLIVCESGYAVPLEMARIWAEQTVDAPLRWWRADLA